MAPVTPRSRALCATASIEDSDSAIQLERRRPSRQDAIYFRAKVLPSSEATVPLSHCRVNATLVAKKAPIAAGAALGMNPKRTNVHASSERPTCEKCGWVGNPAPSLPVRKRMPTTKSKRSRRTNPAPPAAPCVLPKVPLRELLKPRRKKRDEGPHEDFWWTGTVSRSWAHRSSGLREMRSFTASSTSCMPRRPIRSCSARCTFIRRSRNFSRPCSVICGRCNDLSSN